LTDEAERTNLHSLAVTVTTVLFVFADCGNATGATLKPTARTSNDSRKTRARIDEPLSSDVR
jgi:hypothetical protein